MLSWCVNMYIKANLKLNESTTGGFNEAVLLTPIIIPNTYLCETFTSSFKWAVELHKL